MISEKQMKILAFPYSHYDALICDGAVRSGKTSIMMWAFISWAMRDFNGQRFGICGKTVDSTTKNIVVPFISMSLAKETYTLKWRRSEKLLEVRRGPVVNYFEVFGGKDEASFMLIQGRTLAGVLLDEVVLMPESFVNQALARCSVDGARFWFSCNPENPGHWFKQEWINKREQHNALYLHFAMTDNPSLSQKTLERYKSMYSGVFYDRYILGKWCLAEGLVYPMFGEASHVISEQKMPHNRTAKHKKIPPYEKYYVSADYGTMNPCVFILWGLRGGVYYAIDEYYYSGRRETPRTDEEHYAALKGLTGSLKITRIIIDPSAASFITLIRRKKEFSVWEADNAVLDGIRECGTALKLGLLLFSTRCKHTIEEFGLYSWDEKKSEDAVIKDNDHAMDAMRYLVKTLKIVPKRTTSQ